MGNICRRWNGVEEVEVLPVAADRQAGGGMSHITHSFHVSQNTLITDPLCLWNLTPSFSVLLLYGFFSVVVFVFYKHTRLCVCVCVCSVESMTSTKTSAMSTPHVTLGKLLRLPQSQ